MNSKSRQQTTEYSYAKRSRINETYYYTGKGTPMDDENEVGMICSFFLRSSFDIPSRASSTFYPRYRGFSPIIFFSFSSWASSALAMMFLSFSSNC